MTPINLLLVDDEKSFVEIISQRLVNGALM
jgi:hypothetical protein